MSLIYYGLTIIALLVTMGAQLYISASYSKYSKIANSRSVTGAQAARLMLDRNGLSDVGINCVGGTLSDHYDPSKKVVNLSSGVYSGNSIAAVAVACHECGHAVQDSKSFALLRLRAALVPVTNIASYAGYFAILIGLFLGSPKILGVGIIAECVILLFQLVTLPVEVDASRRALSEIKSYGLLGVEEYSGGKTMLTAAALTYVAGVVSALMQVLRLFFIFGGRRRD